jgi:hypothetical protein
MSLRALRICVFAITILVASYTSFGFGFGLLFAGAGSVADIAIFLVPAIALPLAILAWYKSLPAAVLFMLGYALNVGFQIRQFRATLHQLLSNYSGFWQISSTGFLLTVLATVDLVIRYRARQNV